MTKDLIDLNEINMEEKKYPDPIFTNGLVAQMPNPKLPDNWLIDLNIKPHDFFKWCQDNMQFADSNGWIKVNIKKSKTKGTIYGELNQFKPTPKAVVDTETGEVIPDVLPEPTPEVDTTHKTLDPETGQETSLEDIPF